MGGEHQGPQGREHQQQGAGLVAEPNEIEDRWPGHVALIMCRGSWLLGGREIRRADLSVRPQGCQWLPLLGRSKRNVKTLSSSQPSGIKGIECECDISHGYFLPPPHHISVGHARLARWVRSLL